MSEADRGDDLLLRDAFAALKGNLRPYDPVVRWADDQFLCAVSESTPGSARRCIEDVRGALAGPHPRAAFSAGLATLADDEGFTKVLERVELALNEDRGGC